MHGEADVVDVRCAVIRRRTALSTQFAGGVDEIDERVAGAQLRETDIAGAAFQSTTQYVPVEGDHIFEIRNAQDDVIDTGDIDRILFRHAGHGTELPLRPSVALLHRRKSEAIESERVDIRDNVPHRLFV